MGDRTCPQCGSRLNRLSGADGYAVERVLTKWMKTVTRKVFAVVHTCPSCDYAE